MAIYFVTSSIMFLSIKRYVPGLIWWPVFSASLLCLLAYLSR